MFYQCQQPLRLCIIMLSSIQPPKAIYVICASIPLNLELSFLALNFAYLYSALLILSIVHAHSVCFVSYLEYCFSLQPHNKIKVLSGCFTNASIVTACLPASN